MEKNGKEGEKVKIKLVVEKGDKFVEVPFTKKELDDLMDVCWYCVDEPDMKANGIDIGKLTIKLTHIVNDIIYDGTLYELKETKSGKIISVKSKEKYFFKKPKWKVKNQEV